MLHLLQMGPSKVLTTFPLQIQSSWQLSLLELPPCGNTVTPSSDSSDMYTSTIKSAPPPLLMLHSLPTLVSRPLIPPSSHFISSPSAPSPPSLAPGCPSTPPASSPPDSLRVLQWNAGGLRARSTELLHFLSSHPVDLICIQESKLNSSSFFRIPGFFALRSDRTHSRSGILCPDDTHASGGVIIFVKQGLSFSELSTSSLSLLDPYSDYVGVNISFNDSSSLSFLNVYAPPIRSSPTDGRTDSFSPSILPSSRNLFILGGDFNCHHPLWDSRGTSDPRREEVFDWVISSDFLPPNDPDTPTPLHRSSSSRSSPDISFAPSSLAPGSCFSTWVLTIYLFFYPSLSLRPIAPTSIPLPSIFRKLAGMALPHTLTFTVLRGILVSFFFLCCCSFYLSGTECGQICHSFRPHQTPS